MFPLKNYKKPFLIRIFKFIINLMDRLDIIIRAILIYIYSDEDPTFNKKL